MIELCSEGEAIRIVTGGVIPKKSDTIIIQEDCEKIEAPDGTYIKLIEKPKYKGEYVRNEGLDYKMASLFA